MFNLANNSNWDYHFEYIETDVRQSPAREYLAQRYPDQNFPKYAISASLPRLLELGAHGWELIQMQPVELGKNGDHKILVSGGGDFTSSTWSNMYLCIFKRTKNT